jgi:hypothetical protein
MLTLQAAILLRYAIERILACRAESRQIAAVPLPHVKLRMHKQVPEPSYGQNKTAPKNGAI